MRKSYSRRIGIPLAASIIIAPFFFFSARNSDWYRGTLASSSGVQALIYPLEAAGDSLLKSVNGVWESYIFLVNTHAENVQLKKELRLIEAKVLDYDHLLAEANRLRRLLEFRTTVKIKTTVAEVVGLIGHPPFHSVRVSRGRADKIRVGMPVISSKGVMGRIIRVGTHYADVQRIGDHRFQLDVLIARNRIRGILKGGSDERCTLQLQRRADVKIGDTIVTSGISGAFPKGIPVGRVARISSDLDNISQTISVHPWVHPDGLEELIVIQQVSKELDSVLQNASADWMHSVDLLTTTH